tara:strand:+ start:498 stop:1190 length:693 start_codon:yes stop_codon:yes gene_type:complete
MSLNEEHRFIDQYLLPNKKLNHTKVWGELSKMHGFHAEVNRGKQYHTIMEAYAEFKSNNPQDFEHTTTVDTTSNGVSNDIPMDTTKKETKESIKTPITEQSICDWLNKRTATEFKLTGEQFSSYDADEPRYLAEIKVRNSFYSTCMIEFPKWEENVELADIRNKDFLYIVAVCPSIYVFNITTLNKKKWNYQWEMKALPQNTAFGGQDNLIEKKVGYINVTEAKIIPCSL